MFGIMQGIHERFIDQQLLLAEYRTNTWSAALNALQILLADDVCKLSRICANEIIKSVQNCVNDKAFAKAMNLINQDALDESLWDLMRCFTGPDFPIKPKLDWNSKIDWIAGDEEVNKSVLIDELNGSFETIKALVYEKQTELISKHDNNQLTAALITAVHTLYLENI